LVVVLQVYTVGGLTSAAIDSAVLVARSFSSLTCAEASADGQAMSNHKNEQEVRRESKFHVGFCFSPGFASVFYGEGKEDEMVSGA
jgi:uncharacterized protein YfiM (DUF2279 family)